MTRYSLKFGSLGQVDVIDTAAFDNILAEGRFDEGEPRCYTDEWKRSNPDYVVFLPQEFIGRDTDNVHFLVTITPGGDLLGFWTQGTYEGADNECVVAARSTDGGETWSKPEEIDGPDERNQVAAYASPVVSDSGRIYLFYSKLRDPSVIETISRHATTLTCRVSDDDGRTWSDTMDIPMRRTKHDADDPGVPTTFVIWRKPIRDSKGRWMFSYSAWTHPSKYINPKVGGEGRCMFIRFDNINDGPELRDLKLTFLPDDEDGLTAPHPADPNVPRSWEGSLTLLPDGRLFSTWTTVTGSLWCSVSADDGATWRKPEPLRYQDGGERVLHPPSPGPLFPLEDGRYLLQTHNNDGRGSLGAQPQWSRAYFFCRRSQFLSVGEFRPNAHQPVWFSQPKLLADSDGVAAGVQGRTEMGTYGSLTEHNGKRILWYPDRKHFLLGKEITDEWLSDMKVDGER